MELMLKEEYDKKRGRVLAAETTQQYLTGMVIRYPYPIEHPSLPLLDWIKLATHKKIMLCRRINNDNGN